MSSFKSIKINSEIAEHDKSIFNFKTQTTSSDEKLREKKVSIKENGSSENLIIRKSSKQIKLFSNLFQDDGLAPRKRSSSFIGEIEYSLNQSFKVINKNGNIIYTVDSSADSVDENDNTVSIEYNDSNIITPKSNLNSKKNNVKLNK